MTHQELIERARALEARIRQLEDQAAAIEAAKARVEALVRDHVRAVRDAGGHVPTGVAVAVWPRPHAAARAADAS